MIDSFLRFSKGSVNQLPLRTAQPSFASWKQRYGSEGHHFKNFSCGIRDSGPADNRADATEAHRF